MTECAACGLFFSGTSSFDAHRVGRHAYTFSEGLRLDPLREDGRRCLHPSEMGEARVSTIVESENEAGMERSVCTTVQMELDSRGRWRIVASEKQLQGIARMRAGAPTNAQGAIEGLEGTSGRAAA